MRLPIDYDHYGYRFLDKGKWGELHPGDDLNGKGGGNADLGLPIYAPTDGSITHIARNVKSWGNHFHLKIETPFGTRWCHFAHCDQILVNVDDQVKEGQQIATVGNSVGNADFVMTAHLHYEIKKNPTGVAFYPDKTTTKEWLLENYEDPTEFTKRVNEEQGLDYYFMQKGIPKERRVEYVKTLEKDRERFWTDLEEEKKKTTTYENLRKQIADILNCSPDFPAIIGEIHRLMEDADKEGAVEKQRDILRKAIYDALGDPTMPLDDDERLSTALRGLLVTNNEQVVQLKKKIDNLTVKNTELGKEIAILKETKEEEKKTWILGRLVRWLISLGKRLNPFKKSQ